MKAKMICVSLAVFLALLAASTICAQEKPGSEPKRDVAAKPLEIPLKIQIVLTEFDGSQKVSSLPYAMYTVATDAHNHRRDHLRFGVRVPVSTSSNSSAGSAQYTYIDVGTNIDCAAVDLENGQFSLDLSVERSSVAISVPDGKATDWKPGAPSPGPQPLIRSFRDDLDLIMRDGQTMEGSSAVDPITGHVLKIEVALNVLK